VTGLVSSDYDGISRFMSPRPDSGPWIGEGSTRLAETQNGMAGYIERFQNLRTGRVGDHIRPHKPVMLLTILTLVEAGRLPENRILFEPELVEIFRHYFEIVREEDDVCTPINPFFYLRSDGFFHHKPHPGQEGAYAAMRDPGGLGIITRVIAHGYVDDELFALISQAQHRVILRDSLIRRYFPRFALSLLALYEEEREVGLYQELLDEQTKGLMVRENAPAFGEGIRDRAFRRTVTSAYDYRCAACGARVLVEGDSMVDAAHLIPFRISMDDDPRNGIALCKNHHWAMDRFLIAPGPDGLWHVSDLFDRRIKDHQPVLDLNSLPILKPAERRFHPKQESLAWRMDRLFGK
jgi:putative restriction endonuclease